MVPQILPNVLRIYQAARRPSRHPGGFINKQGDVAHHIASRVPGPGQET